MSRAVVAVSWRWTPTFHMATVSGWKCLGTYQSAAAGDGVMVGVTTCGTNPGRPTKQLETGPVGVTQFVAALSWPQGVFGVTCPRLYSSNHGQFRSRVPPAAPKWSGK